VLVVFAPLSTLGSVVRWEVENCSPLRHALALASNPVIMANSRKKRYFQLVMYGSDLFAWAQVTAAILEGLRGHRVETVRCVVWLLGGSLLLHNTHMLLRAGMGMYRSVADGNL
jgi:hypothetical protein